MSAIAEYRQEALRRLFPDIRVIHVPALYDRKDPWYSYKLISLYKAVEEVSLPGAFIELGVYRGRCARFLSKFLFGGRKLYLLDSFKGLPEDWVGIWKKGAFSMLPDEIPVFDSPDIYVIPGWFKDTVPLLAQELQEPLAFIHVDADLYSSTRDALDALNAHIVPGTIILFDEYFMILEKEFSDDEHRALLDWCREYGREFEYLWRTEWVQVAIRITK
ncbi:hypothetical protein CO613_03530 [Lysobacteraceae bacterium NML07-0707]|nr:hypothetical protein CO613_03530 [Xanthomonadaceae bacterium NML07-0707]